MDWTFIIPVVEYESLCCDNTFSFCNMVSFYAIGALLISFHSCIPLDCSLCFCPHFSHNLIFFYWHTPAFSLVFNFVPSCSYFHFFFTCVLQVFCDRLTLLQLFLHPQSDQTHNCKLSFLKCLHVVLRRVFMNHHSHSHHCLCKSVFENWWWVIIYRFAEAEVIIFCTYANPHEQCWHSRYHFLLSNSSHATVCPSFSMPTINIYWTPTGTVAKSHRQLLLNLCIFSPIQA